MLQQPDEEQLDALDGRRKIKGLLKVFVKGWIMPNCIEAHIQ
jgi:hypothetical protein